MDYISVEEFLKQPEKVQKVLLDWWQPEKFNVILNVPSGDFDIISNIIDSQIEIDNRTAFLWDEAEIKKHHIPLLTETQLRKFIEEKTGGHVDCAYYNYSKDEFYGYTIGIWIDNPYKCVKEFKDLGKDLLQAYWTVACKIAAQ